MTPGPLMRAHGRVPHARVLARACATALAAALVALAPAGDGDAAQAKKAHGQAGQGPARAWKKGGQPAAPGQKAAGRARGDQAGGKKKQRPAAPGENAAGSAPGEQATGKKAPPAAPQPAAPVPQGRGKKPGKTGPAKAKTGNGAGKEAKAEAQAVASPAVSPPAPEPVPAPATPAPVAAPPADSGSEERALAKRRSARNHPKKHAAGRGSGQGEEAVAGDRAAGDAPAAAPLVAARAPATQASSRRKPKDESHDGGGLAPVTRTVRDIVEVVPDPVKVLLATLGILSLVLGGVYVLTAARARRLARQRSDLLQEVGLLQTALLPPVPATVGAVRTSVAYQPSDGPGAGGDFYDALTLSGGRAAFILGDVSGHGRQALARTAFMRYTMRAYLEAGLEPRVALQVASRVVDDHLGGDFATVVLAVHDPRSGSLTYACAGHPAPIVVGPTRPEPVLAASSPPIGLGLRTGVRQTTLPLPPGSVVCLYTDGLAEARTERGVLGRPRLGDIVAELGRDVTAQELLDHVADEARIVSDDMATVVLTPTAGVTAGGFRSEQLEIDAKELGDGLGERFLEACGCGPPDIQDATAEVEHVATRYGGAVLHVRYGVPGPRVEVLPRNVESLEAASLRAAASSA